MIAFTISFDEIAPDRLGEIARTMRDSAWLEPVPDGDVEELEAFEVALDVLSYLRTNTPRADAAGWKFSRYRSSLFPEVDLIRVRLPDSLDPSTRRPRLRASLFLFDTRTFTVHPLV